MISEIICTECNEVIGSLKKPEISQADLDLWQEQTTCSQNHVQKVALEIQPD